MGGAMGVGGWPHLQMDLPTALRLETHSRKIFHCLLLPVCLGHDTPMAQPLPALPCRPTASGCRNAPPTSLPVMPHVYLLANVEGGA